MKPSPEQMIEAYKYFHSIDPTCMVCRGYSDSLKSVVIEVHSSRMDKWTPDSCLGLPLVHFFTKPKLHLNLSDDMKVFRDDWYAILIQLAFVKDELNKAKAEQYAAELTIPREAINANLSYWEDRVMRCQEKEQKTWANYEKASNENV